MYQVVIATPMGELGTMPLNEEQKSKMESKILSNIAELKYIYFDLEDGQRMYMSKGMIDSSVFFLKKIQ